MEEKECGVGEGACQESEVVWAVAEGRRLGPSTLELTDLGGSSGGSAVAVLPPPPDTGVVFTWTKTKQA